MARSLTFCGNSLKGNFFGDEELWEIAHQAPFPLNLMTLEHMQHQLDEDKVEEQLTMGNF